MTLFSTLFNRHKASTKIVENPVVPLIEAHLVQAHFLFKLDEFQTAIHHCNQVLALDPTQARAYQLRGVCRSELGDFTGAGEDLRFSLNLS